jgi:Mannosyl-glycoprotein endo-beta-N-acetylglucosaminidase
MSKTSAFLLVSIVVGVLAWYLYSTMSSEGRTRINLFEVQAATLDRSQQDTTTFAVQGRPTVSAQFINTVLCTPSTADTPVVSPACGTGQALYDDGVQAGIDPVYALAFFLHESTFGRYGVARTSLALGNIRCTPGYACYQGYRAYTSYAEGYADWYKLITAYIEGRIDGCPCTTVAQIVKVYAPTSENDTPGYIRAVTRAVTIWREGKVQG